MKTRSIVITLFLLISVTGICQQKKFHIGTNFQLQPSIFDEPTIDQTSITSLPALSKIVVSSDPEIQVVESLRSYNWTTDINRIQSIKQLSYDYNYDCLGREMLPEMNEFVRTEVINQNFPNN